MLRQKISPLSVGEAKEKLRLTAMENPPLISSLLAATRQHPKAGLLTALAAGMVLGSSPGARRMIQNLLPLILGNIRLPAPSADDRP